MTGHWHRIAAMDAELLTNHPKLIAALASAFYKSAGLDLKRGGGKGRVFGLKIDYADRILATTIEHNSKRYLFYLEYIQGHAYQKSPFLNIKGYLGKFLALHHDEIIKILENNYIDIESMSEETEFEVDSELEFIEFNYYGQFIELSNAQNSVLKTTLPNIICGPGGSGKSCLALATIAQHVLNLDENDNSLVLYVTDKSDLVNHVKSIYLEYPSEYRKDKVLFLTYEDLLHHLRVINEKTQHTSATDINEAIREFSVIHKAIHSKSEKFDFNVDKLYEEFRVTCGYSENEYINDIGNDNTSYKSPEERKIIWNAYQYYLNYLKKKSKVDIEFLPHNIKNIFSLVVVDEAHNLSCLMLKLLGQLTNNFNTAYICDTQQQTRGYITQRSFLRRIIYQATNKECMPVMLEESYRCPPLVIDFANRLHDLKRVFVGGATDRFENRKITYTNKHNKAGSVVWISTNVSLENQQRFKNLSSAPSFAVVTLPDLKEEAREKFGTKNVFDDNVKGLQYDVIVAYKIFSHPVFKTINKTLRNSTETKVNYNCPKDGQADNSYSPHFNFASVAITRALRSVIIVDDANEDIKKFLAGTFTTEMTEGSVKEHTTREQWLIEIDMLLRANIAERDAIAKNIFIHRLNGTEQEFNEYLKSFRKPLVSVTTPKIIFPEAPKPSQIEEAKYAEPKPTKADSEVAEKNTRKKGKKRSKPAAIAPVKIDIESFLIAIKNDDVERVKQLFANNQLTINSLYGNSTLLELTVNASACKVCEYLLQTQQADPNKAFRFSPLLVAVMKQYHDIVRVLLADDRTDPNFRIGNSCPLIAAVKNNDLESVVELSKNTKTNFNIYFNDQILLINYLSENRQSVKILEEVLYSDRVTLDFQLNSLQSCLIAAIRAENVEAVKWLLTIIKYDDVLRLAKQTIKLQYREFIKFAKVEHRGTLKKSFEKTLGKNFDEQYLLVNPIHFAIILDNPDILKLLAISLSYTFENHSINVKQLAQLIGNEEILTVLKQSAQIAECLEAMHDDDPMIFYRAFNKGYGSIAVKIMYPNPEGYPDFCSLIEWLAHHGKIDILKLIFHDNNLDLDSIDIDAPIFWAVRLLPDVTRAELDSLFEDANFNPNILNNNECTLLGIAVTYNLFNLASALLDLAITNPNLGNDKNIPLACSASPEMTKMLLEHRYIDPNILKNGYDVLETAIRDNDIITFKLYYYHKKYIVPEARKVALVNYCIYFNSHEILKLILFPTCVSLPHSFSFYKKQPSKSPPGYLYIWKTADIVMNIHSEHTAALEALIFKTYNMEMPEIEISPLFLAVCFNHKEGVHILLAYGAKVEDCKLNALELARLMKADDIVALIENSIANENINYYKSKFSSFL